MTKKLSKPLTFGLFLFLIIAVAGFCYLTVSTFYNGGTDPPQSMQTLLGEGNYVWQALYISNTDGSKYWANAENPFKLASILGNSGDEFKTVDIMQNNIYMNLQDSSGEWSFSCIEKITLKDQDGNTIDTIADQTVTAQGQVAYAGENNWVTGASFSGDDFDDILNQPAGTYTVVITLSDISLDVSSDGLTRHLYASSGSSINVLEWKIKVT